MASLRLEDHVFRVLENQGALFDYLGEHSWGFDMDTGQLHFTPPQSDEWLTACPVQLIGTESSLEGTWLWAWANAESQIPPGLLQGVDRVRQEGLTQENPLFTERKHPLTHDHFGAELAIICAGYLGLPTYYACPYEGGVLFTALEELPEPARRERTPLTAVQAIQAGISELELDHRAAVLAYLGPPSSEDGDATVWQIGDGRLLVLFDDLGRVKEMETIGS